MSPENCTGGALGRESSRRENLGWKRQSEMISLLMSLSHCSNDSLWAESLSSLCGVTSGHSKLCCRNCPPWRYHMPSLSTCLLPSSCMSRGPDLSCQETSSQYQNLLLSTSSAMPSFSELDNSNWSINLIGKIRKEHLIRGIA